jgi:hypothetical protein
LPPPFIFTLVECLQVRLELTQVKHHSHASL